MSTPALWDAQASTLEAARGAVFGLPGFTWDDGVEHCLARILPFMEDEPGTICDFGCGVGRLAVPLGARKPGWLVLGMDHSPRMIELAREQTDLDNVIFACEDGLPIGCFDGLYCVLVMQHLTPQWQRIMLSRFWLTLRPGGWLVVQWVHEGDEGPLSHPVAPEDFAAWAEEAGFWCCAWELDEKIEPWAWLTAFKDLRT
jgi:SAM-dependent methyltransferase